MISRGTRSSRLLALLVAASPLLIGGAAFASWAASRWIETGSGIADAEERRHEAAARTTQARLYRPLGEAWAEYARTAVSGLAQEETAAETVEATRARIAAIFAERKGRLRAVERLADGDALRPGLQTLRFELRGSAPERSAAAILAELEAEPPYLFVDFLDLQRGRDVRDAPLDLRLRLSLYRFEEGGE